MNKSPLRYPGGKSVMTPFIQELIEYNSLKDIVYAESHAGGAGVAINLLLSGNVDAIKINDINLGLYSFWKYLIEIPKDLIALIEKTDVTLKNWNKQKDIFVNSKRPSLELGFATFFLSRTNRSGILNAGPIGGRYEEAQSEALYKIDCRYNKEVLIQKIENISLYKDLISVYNLDAIDFMRQVRSQNILIYLDPPYYNKGKSLYINYYDYGDHVTLSQFLKSETEFNWILSYDNVNEIRDLYTDFNGYSFSLTYTAQKIKTGYEYLTHSKGIQLPESLRIKRRNAMDIELLPID